MGLREAIGGLKSVYLLPRDNVAESVISPALGHSHDVSIMMGFFTSASLAEIAPGLAAYIQNSNEPLRLIISPYITADDQAILKMGDDELKEAAFRNFENAWPDADDFGKHALACLAWLLAHDRLQIKVAVMRNGLFHSKVWLFRDHLDRAVLHGSANLTHAALRKNREQLTLAREWRGEDGLETYVEFEGEFKMLWEGGDTDCKTLDLPEAILAKLLRDYKSDLQPSEADFTQMWRKAHGLAGDPVSVERLLSAAKERNFQIPSWLDYRTGDFAHQGRAVDAWQQADYRGVLEMCTGSGKTLTALVGAYHLHQRVGPLLIVVAAPYKVLVSQWCDEIALFNIQPVNLTECGGPTERAVAINDARRRLDKGVSRVEALVVSNDTLCTPQFQDLISRFRSKKLIVSDECHNLGAPAFISSPPDFFDYRLGLSATPVRQYDGDGTDALFHFFGQPCFKFALEDAIGVCLTPYDYHVHFAELSSEEMDEWREISNKISKLAWKLAAGGKDEYLESLLLKRRRILETASAKVGVLSGLLDLEIIANLRYTLIYATDKDPKQLNKVNDLLRHRGIVFHQLTAEETSNSAVASALLSRFQSGSLQVLTAKRVLDEGVNVPQIMRAYILASTTVRRQWVQRRGRLLRQCKAIGKEHAVIHDVVALPPGSFCDEKIDADAKKIVNSELDRVWEFARLSRNASDRDGPFEAVEKLRSMVDA